jgi:cell division protein FtsN
MHKYKRQQGGTILGIIIGLVIGLGIALAVAMVITKTPMPFTDKSGRQKAFEQGSGPLPDPNKPMYGNRDKIKEAAKDFMKGVLPPENPDAPQNTAAPQPADKVREVIVGGDSDGNAPVIERSTAEKPKKADAATPAPADAAKADAADDKWSYFLQAGAFREQVDADAMRAKLALQGVEAKVSERQSETGVLYRVRVGPFSQLEAMNKVRGKLSDNGIDAAVVRVAK